MSFLVKEEKESHSHHEIKEYRHERFNKGLPINAIYDSKTRNKVKIYNEVTDSYEEQIYCTQCGSQLDLRCMKHNLPLTYNNGTTNVWNGWKNCIENCSTMCYTYYAPDNKGCDVCIHWTERNLDEKPEDNDKIEITQEIIQHLNEIYQQLNYNK